MCKFEANGGGALSLEVHQRYWNLGLDPLYLRVLAKRKPVAKLLTVSFLTPWHS